jgi:hypothetical protein
MDNLHRVLEAVRMDLYADYVGMQENGDAITFFVYRDWERLAWSVDAEVLAGQKTDTHRINLIVDGFRQTHKKLGA